MVSTTEACTENIPISPRTSTPVKKPSAQKSLCMFTNTLKVKSKTAYRWVEAAKSKRKAIKFRNTPWALKKYLKGNSKIDEHIKKSLYNWIMHHPQVLQSPIVNDFWSWKLMIKMNRNWFQNCYCRCPSENFITTLLATQTMLDSKKQEMKTIISLSEILNYVHYCHPN